MTCGEAIYSEYKNAMPQVLEDYMAEIGEIIERYGGTTACENKLTLLHVQYYKAAESEYKQLITWIGNVAEGSYDYWNEDYKNWNPRLSGRFWDETLRIGTPIVLADMSGVAEYFFKYRWGMILGPISWKVGAAYAAASSIFAGATTLINEINSRNGGLSYYIEDVSFHEIYEIYLQRKEELGI